MTLTDEQNDELEEMLQCINNNLLKLNEWEKGFAEDNYHRFQRYGNQIILSAKQWEVLYKLYKKVQE